MANKIQRTITEFELKDADEKFPGGIIEGYASTFGNRDLHDEIVITGAFKKSVAEFNRGSLIVPLLDQHRTFDSANAAIGRIIELKEPWQPIAYDVSARLSGVEIAETPRKRRGGRRRKVEQLGESEHPQGLDEEPENSRGDE